MLKAADTGRSSDGGTKIGANTARPATAGNQVFNDGRPVSDRRFFIDREAIATQRCRPAARISTGGNAGAPGGTQPRGSRGLARPRREAARKRNTSVNRLKLNPAAYAEKCWWIVARSARGSLLCRNAWAQCAKSTARTVPGSRLRGAKGIGGPLFWGPPIPEQPPPKSNERMFVFFLFFQNLWYNIRKACRKQIERGQKNGKKTNESRNGRKNATSISRCP